MEEGESRFLALADELLVEIIARIDDRQSLCNIARVSSRLQGLAEPFIWNSVLVRTGRQVVKLHKIFQSRESRLRAVHDLQIRYTYRDEKGIEFLNDLMEQLVQLRHLTIESPCCNDNPWGDRLVLWDSSCRIEYTKFFEKAVLSQLSTAVRPKLFGQLRSVKLHAHGNGQGHARFDLGRSVVIFLLKNLRSIELSCFDIGINDNLEALLSKFDGYKQSAKFTNLKTLIFEECNIDSRGLQALLKIPKALENLTLGERMFHCKEGHLPLGFNSRLMEILEPQRYSIKYLKHVGGGRYWSENHALSAYSEDLSYLTNLETVELGLGLDVKYMKYPLSPTLRTLRLLDAAPASNLDFVCSLLMRYQLWAVDSTKQKHRRKFDIVLGRTHIPRGRSTEYWLDFWDDQELRERVKALTTKLSKQNTGLAIYKLKDTAASFIPPYMYGEELPEEQLAYISSKPKDFGGETYEDPPEDEADEEKQEDAVDKHCVS